MKRCPVFVYEVYHFSLNFDVNRLSDFCFKLQNNNKGRVRSNLGGWQSNDLFDEYSIISDLRKLIFEKVKIAAEDFNLSKEIKLDNLWININEYKDTNMIHCHPQSILSGVYYVKVPKDSGDLRFFSPTEDLMETELKDNVKEYNVKNGSTGTFYPRENMLLVFPSWLKHCVLPNMNKHDKRISISFNVGFK